MKRLSLLLILVLAAARTLPAATPQEDEAVTYRTSIDEGISLLRIGSLDDIHRSIAKFTSARKVRPESAEAYYWLALAYSDLNNYRRAAENARSATIYGDNLPEAWLLWGQVLLYQREWHEALSKLQTAASLDPENPFIQYNLGRVYYHGFKDPDAALSHFRAAWQMGQSLRRDNPEMIALAVRSRLYMGCCEYDRGMRENNLAYIENAFNAFSDVIREQPNNYDAQFRLALAMRRRGNTNESAQIMRSLVDFLKKKNDPADQPLLAEIYLQLADTYLKETNLVDRDLLLVQVNLREFVALIGNGSHPALDAAREYLSINDQRAISGQ